MAEILKIRRIGRHSVDHADAEETGSAAARGSVRKPHSTHSSRRSNRSARRRRRTGWGTVFALSGATAMLAFLASFAIPVRYEANTRLLVRSRDATVLSSTGNDLRSQPGIVDSTLGASLVNTQIAVLGSHDIASEIVERLQLDNRPKPTGAVADLKGFVAGSIKRTRAYVMHGMYKEPSRRDAAIQDVREGLLGAPVGESFVLAITGSGGSPEDATQITDAAADLLIETSATRTSEEAEAHREALQKQLDDAYTSQSAAEQAIAELKRTRSITNLDASLVLSETGLQELRSSLNETNAELDAVTARLKATKAQLARTPRTSATTSEIQTGRSSTEVSSETTSSTYTSLLNATQTMEADVAGLTAKSSALSKILATTPPTAAALPAAEAALRMAELKRDVATSVVQTLSVQYEAAAARTQGGAVELTRLDRADVPLYPAAPQRWMYLFLGLTLGALSGFVITYRRMARAGAFRPNAARALHNDWDADTVIGSRETQLELPFAARRTSIPQHDSQQFANNTGRKNGSDNDAETDDDYDRYDDLDDTSDSTGDLGRSHNGSGATESIDLTDRAIFP